MISSAQKLSDFCAKPLAALCAGRLITALFFAVSTCAEEPAPLIAERPAITSARAIKDLSPAEVEKRPAVRLEGVVTYYDPRSYLFFVQDQTAGIYVTTETEDHGFRAGDLIRVEGVAAKGNLSNCIEEPVFKLLSRADLPAPVKLSDEQITNPATDCDRVE